MAKEEHDLDHTFDFAKGRHKRYQELTITVRVAEDNVAWASQELEKVKRQIEQLQ